MVSQKVSPFSSFSLFPLSHSFPSFVLFPFSLFLLFYHASLLKPYLRNNDELSPGRNQSPPEPDVINDEEEFEVEEILDVGTRHRKKEYLINGKNTQNMSQLGNHYAIYVMPKTPLTNSNRNVMMMKE